MEPERSHLELVRQAVAGDSESAAALASAVENRVRAYLNRIVLDEDKSQELTQDTMAVVMGSLGSLRQPERFWPWVFRIATNKSRQHFRYQSRHRAISMSALGEESFLDHKGTYEDGLLQLARQEMGELTRAALSALSERYRMALTLRFYEDLPHSDIATVLGCSEITARATFFRAKHALVRELKRRGIREGSLFVALIAFGQLTAPSSSSAAVAISASAATESAITGLLTAKAKAAVAAVLVVATIGTWVLLGGQSHAGLGQQTFIPARPAAMVGQSNNSTITERLPAATTSALSIHTVSIGANLGAILSKDAVYDIWLYFPQGVNGPHLEFYQPTESGRMEHDSFIHTAEANYRIKWKQREVHIVNDTFCCNPQMHTAIIPTDSAEVCAFIHSIDGDQSHALLDKRGFDFQRDSKTGYVVSGMDKRGKDPYRITLEYGPPTKDDPFPFVPPTDMKIVDERDAMRKRGWTCFRISGQLGGQEVAGAGRIPFFYTPSMTHGACLTLKVGGKLRLIDDGRVVHVFDEQGRIVSSHLGGSSFTGLTRPWMGFHAVDTIRRDAAEKQIWYSTELNDGRAAITLVQDHIANPAMARYTVNMSKDLLERIEFYTGPDGVFEELQGSLSFEYLQDVDQVSNEFSAPSLRDEQGGAVTARLDPLWPLSLLPAGKKPAQAVQLPESAHTPRTGA